jgi:hypothetical protein
MSFAKFDGVDGESRDTSHDQWTDLDGGGSSQSNQPPAGADSGHDGSSGSNGGSKGSPVNPTTMVIVGMMIFALAAVAVLANRNKGSDDAQEEIVFEPEVISLDEGSAILNASYSTEDSEFFDAYGEDEIQLTITPLEDQENRYYVEGSRKSVQKVRTYGMDRGVLCPIDLQHDVEYTVSGTLSPKSCLFFITVILRSESSELLAYGCSVDLGLDFSPLYIAPRTDELQFSTVREKKKSESFEFYLYDVHLPSGVNCPSFVQ